MITINNNESKKVVIVPPHKKVIARKRIRLYDPEFQKYLCMKGRPVGKGELIIHACIEKCMEPREILKAALDVKEKVAFAKYVYNHISSLGGEGDGDDDGKGEGGGGGGGFSLLSLFGGGGGGGKDKKKNEECGKRKRAIVSDLDRMRKEWKDLGNLPEFTTNFDHFSELSMWKPLITRISNSKSKSSSRNTTTFSEIFGRGGGNNESSSTRNPYAGICNGGLGGGEDIVINNKENDDEDDEDLYSSK